MNAHSFCDIVFVLSIHDLCVFVETSYVTCAYNVAVRSMVCLESTLYFNKCSLLLFREQGQGTTEELRSRDFRKELDEREKETKGPSVRRQNEPIVKRPKTDQVPAASLDADDPLEGDSSDSDDSDDDTAALLAELNKIKKERAIEQAKKVCFS